MMLSRRIAQKRACKCSRRLLPSSKRTIAAGTATAPISPTTPTNDTAELLEDVKDLLGRYPVLRHSTWDRRLDRALVDLQTKRRARITVVGEKTSGVSRFVTALLDDPLSVDQDLSVALEARRLKEDAPSIITVTYGDRTEVSRDEIAIASQWLHASRSDLTEIVISEPLPPSSILDELYATDILVLHTSDLIELSSPTIRSLITEHSSRPTSTLLLVVDASSTTSATATTTRITSALESLPLTRSPKCVLVSSNQAQFALEALLPEDSTSPPSYERFQSGYIASGLLDLKDSLTASTSGITIQSGDGTTSLLQEQTAKFVLEKAVNATIFAVATAADSLRESEASLSKLVASGEEETNSFLSNLGVRTTTTPPVLEIPSEDLLASRTALRDVVQTRLAWHKLPFRADDIQTELSIAIGNTYLRGLEERLIFAAGQGPPLSSSLSQQTDTLLSSPLFSESNGISPIENLYSPVLLNKIEQSTLSFPPSSIVPSLLTSPLHARRSQILTPGGPSSILQSRAQGIITRFLTQSSSATLLAVLSEVGGWAETGTNVGVGLLGVLGSVWWGQRSWDKAVRRFLRDVEERVTTGLERDLGAAAVGLVDRALHKLRTAVSGGEDLLRRRKNQVESLTNELRSIEERRRSLR